MYEYSAKVVRVVDGDTVDVDIDLGFGIVYSNQRIRMYGIDTPESRTRDLVEKKFGLYAKEFLKSMLGKTCTLRTHKDKSGKFGRILGEFMVYDHKTDSVQSVKDIMIRENIGVAYYGQSKEDIQAEHYVNFGILIEKGFVE